MAENPIWTVTTMEGYPHGKSRVWGFYYSAEEAIASVKKELPAINDPILDYAVVEMIYSGFCPMVFEDIFFKFDKDSKEFNMLESKPGQFRGVKIFSIG